MIRRAGRTTVLCWPALVDLAAHITAVLAPSLGANTADSVTRHLLAKHGIGGNQPIDAETARALQDTLRRGLVAFVGAEQAQVLASRCLEPVQPTP
jgi:hypothetical protein